MHDGGAVECLRQFEEGQDFDGPGLVLRDLTPEQATRIPEGAPYSIAGVVAHALFWHQKWLDRIEGKPVKEVEDEDVEGWPIVFEEQWTDLCQAYLEQVSKAKAIAQEPNADRKLPNGHTVAAQVIRVAVHGSYHLGEIVLLRRMMKLWPPAGAE